MGKEVASGEMLMWLRGERESGGREREEREGVGGTNRSAEAKCKLHQEREHLMSIRRMSSKFTSSRTLTTFENLEQSPNPAAAPPLPRATSSCWLDNNQQRKRA